MEKTNKIILLFYLCLGVSLITVYSYFDSLYERPLVDHLPTEPIKKISFENIVNTRTHQQMFDVITDVENYPKVLPKNVLSIKVLNKTDSFVIAQEELNEIGIKTTLTVKHSFVPMEKHIIEILDGDAKGTLITQYFEDDPNGLKIKTDVDLNLKGILFPIGFLPKSSLQHAVNTVIGEFAIYAKTKYVLSENENTVDSLYREILLRRADPDGLKFYVKMLEEEKMTSDDIRKSLINSEEYQKLMILKEYSNIDSIKSETKKAINELYLEILKRPADEKGLLYYSAMFESGKFTLDDIKNELQKSEEYKTSDK